jgi:hypothetical protein
LEDKLTLDYSPLYKINIKELEVAWSYIINNLEKRFIILNNILFVFPILIAKKLGGDLRFCVDYWKLNTIIKKDQYSLSFVDEIMD